MLDPQDALGIERATVGAYEWAELVLITMIAESLATVAETPTWASEQLLELQRLKRRTAQVTAELQRDTPALLEDAVEQAYTKGRIMAEAELITHRRAGHSVPGVVEEPAAEIAGPSRRILPKPTPVAKPTHANRAILNITRAGVNALHPIHGQIGRRTDDIWRRIINEASGSVATGDASPKKAIQEAFTRMTRKGLGFYEDSAGRKWGLDTYAEMAVRTTANNALLAGHTDALQAAGADLVVVSSHKNPAPQCAPFERKVLSLSGKYGPGSHVVDGETVHVKATMRQAEASGLHHPNCRHTHSLFIPGVTPTNAPPVDDDHVGYRATQRQRYLERQIRASRRMEAAAMDDDARRRAVSRRRAYEAKLREHVGEWDLPRRRDRETLR